jgi:ATP-binding cassette subfamily B protein
MEHISTKQVFLFIWRAVRSFPVGLTIMVITALIWAIELSLKPYLLRIIIDRISVAPAEAIFEYVSIPTILYFMMTFLYSTGFRVYEYYVNIKMTPLLRTKIADATFELLLNQDAHYYQNNLSGSLANKTSDLTSSIPEMVGIIIDRFFSHGLALIIAIYTLGLVNIKFALIMLTWSGFFIIGSLIFSKKLTYFANVFSEWGSTINGTIVDVLSNIVSVRLFARNKTEKSTLISVCNQAVVAEQKLQWAYFWIWFWYGYSFVFVQGISLYYLLKGRQAGWITVGDFVLVVSINFGIVEFLWQLAKDFSQFSRLLGKVIQALRTILVVPNVQDSPNATVLSVKQGAIVFDSVQFQYEDTDPLFQNKSIVIQPGQKVGLVGYSGGGKTTFVNLILRLYEVSSGRILIDDQDIQSVTQNSLRESIGMIPQEPLLFHRTLMENIRYGCMDASDEAVRNAAKRAHAHDFIENLKDGYNSLVGERGVKLSGGQRQRVAIARALLKNAPILILDEATSQLDSITEKLIQASLQELMQGKTTIVIAHRLSTLLNMDRVLVFDQGKIVQDGSHQDLLHLPGLYKELWEAQVGGFLQDIQ